jgi:hypothetical protein
MTLEGRLGRQSSQVLAESTVEGRLGRQSAQVLSASTVEGRLGRQSVQVLFPTPVVIAPSTTLAYTLTAPSGFSLTEGRILVDWDDDGTFGGTGENITTRVRWPTVRTTRGNTSGRRILPPSAGTASLIVDNQTGDYYPDNGGSPLSPNVIPGRRLRIQDEHLGTLYRLWTGHIDDIDPQPAFYQQSVGVTGLGALSQLVARTLSTEVFLGKDTGFLVSEVLDAAGWPASRRSIDVGATIVSVWWEEGRSAFAALTRLLNAEGPGALLYEDTDGNIVFKNRFFRSLDTRATVSQATFTDTGETGYTGFTYSYGFRDIINTGLIQVTRREQQASQVVWSAFSPSLVPASGTLTVTARSANPFRNAVVPVEDTDFTTTGGTVTVALSRTTGQTTDITFTETAATDTTILGLQLRASPLTVTARTSVTDTDTTSEATYGLQGVDPRDFSLLQYPEIAADILAAIIQDRKDPRRKVAITLRAPPGSSDAGLQGRLTQAYAREIGDRITVTQTLSGLSLDFWIEHVTHEIGEAGKLQQTTFLCEEVRAATVAASEVFILNSGTQGLLGTNKLGQ